MIEGDVVIVGTGQAGSIIHIGNDIWVLLANANLWIGPSHQVRFPQSQEDLDSCPKEVDRFTQR